MKDDRPIPGVSRQQRLTEEGLQRLHKQLSGGAAMTDTVLAQWIRRYGDAARDIIRHANRYHDAFDDI